MQMRQMLETLERIEMSYGEQLMNLSDEFTEAIGDDEISLAMNKHNMIKQRMELLIDTKKMIKMIHDIKEKVDQGTDGLTTCAICRNKCMIKNNRKAYVTGECPVCQEEYVDPQVLSCGHTYCKGCISKH